MPLFSPAPIVSPRLLIREIVESDLPDLFTINCDPEVTRFLGHAPWDSMKDAEAWFQRISGQRRAGAALEFVMVAQETGGVIGRCALFDFEEINAHAGLGYVLGRPHWRKGYMREALTMVIDRAFREMGIRRLEAKVEAPNTASVALLERLGFVQEGTLRERWMSNGAWIDAAIYGLLRHEWASLSA